MLQAVVLKTRPFRVKAASEAVQSQIEDTGFEQAFTAANMFADKAASSIDCKGASKKGEQADTGAPVAAK